MYFICECRFNKLYQYHLRLLVNFTAKNVMNLPYYLFKSLGRMAEKVQPKKDNPMFSLFHFPLIKILVMYELEKKKVSWKKFLSSLGLLPQAYISPMDICEDKDEPKYETVADIEVKEVG